MNYEDFVLEIAPDRDGRFAVRVQNSPAGCGESSLKLPWPPGEIGPLLQHLGVAVRTSVSRRESEVLETLRKLLPASTLRPDPPSPREVGERLFQALFSGPVQNLYERSRGTPASPFCSPGYSKRGLRLQLKLNPRRSELAPIISMPWELLCQPDTEDFLSLSRHSPVVRSLDVPRPPRPVSFPSPLRILVLISSPNRRERLDLRQERENIEEAFQHAPDIETVYLERADLGALRKALLDSHFHAVHFMGHGCFDRSTGEGALLFEDRQRQPLTISGEKLASQLKDFDSIRLVLLNACDTARSKVDGGRAPFAGVANALVLGGIPAVVAMQFPISDRAAIAFSRAFYQRLAAGDPIDAAVVEGRQEIAASDPGTLEWATPVLFLNARGATGDGTRPGERGALYLALAILLLAVIVVTIPQILPDRPTRTAEPNHLARQLLDEGRIDEARRELETALAADPASAETWSHLGELEERDGRMVESHAAYRQAADLAPDNELHQYNYASALIGLERYEEAARLLEKTLKIATDDADALNDLGWIYLRLGRPEAARPRLERGLSIESAVPSTRAALHKNLGRASLETGDPEAAVESLETALRTLGPQQSKLRLEARLLLAGALAALGRNPEACDELRRFAADSGLLYPWKPDPEKLAEELGCPLNRQSTEPSKL